MAQPARFGDKMCVDENILRNVTNKKLGIREGVDWKGGGGGGERARRRTCLKDGKSLHKAQLSFCDSPIER